MKELIEVKNIEEPKKRINNDMLMIIIVSTITVILSLIIILYYTCFVGNKILATYNGGKLTREEYELYYKRYAPYYVYYYGYSATEIIPQMAEQATIDELLYSKALKEKYTLTAEDRKKVDEMFTEEDTIKSMQEQGFNIEEMKDCYYKDAIISSYIEDIKKSVTSEQIKSYIKEIEGENADFNVYNTRHILLQFSDNMTDNEKAKLKKEAESLLKKAKSGSDFAKLAETNSDDTSKKDGGKVRVKKNGTVYEEYINAVLKLKSSQIYPAVVETKVGYHIIKLDSIDKNGRLTDNEDISNYVSSQNFKLLEEANYNAKNDIIVQIGTEIANELGFIATNSVATE